MKPTKSFALLSIFIFVTQISFGQEKDFNPEKLATQTFHLGNTKYDGKEYVKYREVEVIDGRSDTSKIGYWKIKSLPQFVNVTLKNGSKGLEDFINTHYADNFSKSPYALLLVIKKLWVSQLDTTTKEVSTLVDDASVRKAIINLKFEFYLHFENDFYPIIRVDTVSVFSSTDLPNVVMQSLTQSVNTALKKPLFSDPSTIIQSRRKLVRQQITDNITESKKLPVLTSTDFTKGVFTTFSDFLNNKPTLDYNNVDYTKYGDVLYIKEKDGSEYPSNKFWGFCDGKNLFISSGKNFFKLIRVQNSFIFFGTRGLEKKLVYGNFNRFYQGSSFANHNKVEMRYFIYQIDMETGSVL